MFFAIFTNFTHNRLMFCLFSFQIYNVEPSYVQTNDNLVITTIRFKVSLTAAHFQGSSSSSSQTNSLTIRCTAEIPNLYQQFTEMELGLPQKDPVPARGKRQNTHIYKYKRMQIMCGRLPFREENEIWRRNLGKCGSFDSDLLWNMLKHALNRLKFNRADTCFHL